jgi:N-glycosylase/DNA lyase
MPQASQKLPMNRKLPIEMTACTDKTRLRGFDSSQPAQAGFVGTDRHFSGGLAADLSPGHHTGLRLPLDPTQPLDLEITFTCGQIFRWRQEEEWWCGTLGGTALALRRVDGALEVRQAGTRLGMAEIARFLALDDDLPRIYRRIGTDRAMRAAIAALTGLRILRQEPWECLAGFICSAWNNIPKIQGSTAQLARRWGDPLGLELDGQEVALHTFPSPDRLASATETELREAALGFRAPNLLKAAREVAEGRPDLQGLRRAPYGEALQALRRVPGIGRKVADCILLFSLDKPEACPVDVWVWRVMRELYGHQLRQALPAEPPGGSAGPSERAYRAIQGFAWRRWGNCAGYAQQYLFTARRLGLGDE